MNQFLTDRQFMHERLQLGIDVHPTAWELAEFQRLAHAIWPKYEHVSITCQSCVNELVKFVFEKQNLAVKKATFDTPKPRKYGSAAEGNRKSPGE